MTDINQTFDSLQERLESIRAELEKGFAGVAGDLDAVRDAARELQTAGSSHDKKLRQLEERAEGQSELIETLTSEAEEARSLRREVRERDLEVERLNSELDSKKELIKALRQQLGEVDQLKATARQHDKKIFEQQHELDRKQKDLDLANEQIESLKAELTVENEKAADDTAADNAELIALRSELDARKAMIKSLRADVERAGALEGQLADKRAAISALEESIDHHVDTIAELRRSVEGWKKKYEAAKGERVVKPEETLAEPPEFTDTEIEALKALDAVADGPPDRTVAIDMRDALKEARRSKAVAKS